MSTRFLRQKSDVYKRQTFGIPATLSAKIFVQFATPPLILPNPAIYRFVRYHRNSLQAAPADNLLRAESFLQQLYYPFSHCRCKHFLAMFLLLAPVCFSLGKLHAIATTSGVAIAVSYTHLHGAGILRLKETPNGRCLYIRGWA